MTVDELTRYVQASNYVREVVLPVMKKRSETGNKSCDVTRIPDISAEDIYQIFVREYRTVEFTVKEVNGHFNISWS